MSNLDLSDDNLLQLDQLELQITVGEITEHTLEGFIKWTYIDANHMKTRFGEYDLYLSVLNGQGDSHLDVLRHGVNVLTIQSVVLPTVTDLLDVVRALAASPDFYDELITRAYTTYRRCPVFERGNGGIEIGGLVTPQIVAQTFGGVIVDGASNNIFNDVASGGIAIDGDSTIQGSYWVIALGGPAIGGHGIDHQDGDVTSIASLSGQALALAVHPTQNVIYIARSNSIDMYDKTGIFLSTFNMIGTFIVPISTYGISLDATSALLFVSLQNGIYKIPLNGSGIPTGAQFVAYDNSSSPNPGPSGWWASNGPIAVANGGGTIYFSTAGPFNISKIASSNYNNGGFAQASGATIWPGQMLTRSGAPWDNTGYSGDFDSGVQGYNLKTSDFTSQTALTAPLNFGTGFSYDSINDLFYYVGTYGSDTAWYKIPATGGSETRVSGLMPPFPPFVPSGYDPITNSIFLAFNDLYQIVLP